MANAPDSAKKPLPLKAIIVGLGVVIAVGLLALLLNVDDPRPEDDGPAIEAPDDWTGFDPDAPGSTTGQGNGSATVQQVDTYRYEEVNDSGQLVQFEGDRLHPKPDGVMEVEQPRLRIHFERDRRVLAIAAATGVFVTAQGEQRPRHGTLAGDVTVTLFDSQADREVDMSDASPDVAMRLSLDRADFDMDLGQVTSESEVAARGPSFSFEGVGLELTYNALRDRIERLVVPQGRRLTFSEVASGAADDGEGEHVAAGADEAGAEADGAGEGEPSTGESPAAMQAYRLTLEGDVHVVTAEAEAKAHRLTTVLLQPRSETGVDLGQLNESTDGRERVAAERRGKGPAGKARAASASIQLAAPARQDVAKVDTVTVTWTGPLKLVPEADPPAELKREEDAAITLEAGEGEGDEPVIITTTSGQRITGQRVSYMTTGSQVTIDGSAAHPMTLASPDMGTLTGQSFTLDTPKNVGVVRGPGQLVANAAGDGEAAGEPLTLTFVDRMDLDLATREGAGEATNRSDPLGNIVGLKRARVRGEVDAKHPRFSLKADVLDLDTTPSPRQMAEGDSQATANADDSEGLAQPALRQLTAHGHVLVNTPATETEPASRLTAQTLNIGLSPDADGRPQPTRIVATDGVNLTQPGRTVDAGRIEARFAQAVAEGAAAAEPEAKADGDAGGELPRNITDIFASHGVEVQLVEEELHILADRLHAEPLADRITFERSADQPVRIARPQGLITGDTVAVQIDSQIITIETPGSLALADNPDAVELPLPVEADAMAEGATPFTVVWSERMQFDNSQGKADFAGDVVVTARDATDTTRLTADTLQLDLVGPIAADDAELADDNGEAVAEGEAEQAQDEQQAKAVAALRRVREVRAQGEEVRFASESWQDKPGGKLGTRLTLVGPNMRFDGPTEQMHVEGKGWMLVEDYRPADGDPEQAADAQAGVGNGQKKDDGAFAAFSGRGATMFRWTGSLALDAFNNDMRLLENVQMAHKPEGEPKASQLQCEEFIADLFEVGGLGAWMADEPPEPELRAAFANDNVMVKIEDRTVTTDHLSYLAAKHLLELEANRGKMTRVTQDDGRGFSARKIRWDLESNAIDILEAGATRAPVRR